MSRAPRGRLARLLAWLLTPFVVWAAAFLGTWAGAAVGGAVLRGVGSAVAMVVVGAVAGGVAAFGWVRFMRSGRAGEEAGDDG